MRVLLVLDGPPYGTEAAYNGLRLARELARRDDVDVRVFLIGDAVGCAVAGQRVPRGWYDLGLMVRAVARHGSDVGCCGTCMDARGIAEEALVEGARRSTIEELADWTLWADRVMTF